MGWRLITLQGKGTPHDSRAPGQGPPPCSHHSYQHSQHSQQHQDDRAVNRGRSQAAQEEPPMTTMTVIYLGILITFAIAWALKKRS